VQPELVDRARHGDEGAFEALISAAVDRLYAAATLILHDRTLAEEAVQETMIRAWRDLPRLRDVSRFEVWLRRILVHACMDTVRSEPQRSSNAQLDVEWRAPGDEISQLADRDAIGQAFKRLTLEHRSILVLRHYFGYSVPELADLLRLRLGTAKSRLSRAETAMRSALQTDVSRRVEPQEGRT
jgi:RNA polymerase sigma-70 factor (ECF subfamily)